MCSSIIILITQGLPFSSLLGRPVRAISIADIGPPFLGQDSERCSRGECFERISMQEERGEAVMVLHDTTKYYPGRLKVQNFADIALKVIITVLFSSASSPLCPLWGTWSSPSEPHSMRRCCACKLGQISNHVVSSLCKSLRE